MQQFFHSFFLFCFNLFFGCAGSSLLHPGFLQLQWVGAALHCGGQASHRGGFSCCGAQALGCWASVAVAHGLVAPRHVGSSWIRDRTCALCIGRQMLNHWTTREALFHSLLLLIFYCSFLSGMPSSSNNFPFRDWSPGPQQKPKRKRKICFSEFTILRSNVGSETPTIEAMRSLTSVPVSLQQTLGWAD